MNIEVREAHESDIPGILSLTINELGYPGVTLDELSSKMSNMKAAGNYYFYVAVLSGHVVGYAGIAQEMALEVQKDYFRIKEMAVSKEYQRMGIGSTLLRYIEDFATKKEIDYIVLSSRFHRADAHRFYERNGYAKTSYVFAKGNKRTEQE